MARDTPPTLVSYTETVWNTTTSPKTTASISWLANDVIVAMAGQEGQVAIATPTASGLTFTTAASNNNVANTCSALVATAVAASSGSATVSATYSNGVGSGDFGLAVWVWRGSDGAGTAVTQHTSTKTKALTATDAHSAVMWGVFDFAATATTGISLTPTPTNTRQSVLFSPHYTVYVADLVDQASTGATSYGITGGSGTGPFTIVAMEVLGTTTGGGGTTVKPLAQLGVG